MPPIFKGWKSILLLPSLQEQLGQPVDTAHADAVAFDLEDLVPHERKAEARSVVGQLVSRYAQTASDVLVRINAGLRPAALDIECCAVKGVRALILPQCESADWVASVAIALNELEAERGIPNGYTKLVLLVESCQALLRIQEIASSHPRVVALALGAEDFSASAGMSADADSLLYPKQLAIFSARAAGILPLGLVGPIARGNFQPDELLAASRRARDFGSTGAFTTDRRCVGPLNQGFAST